MKRIVIIGGGFAGLSALHTLQSKQALYEIILIDKKKASDFLPLLPDIISGRVRPEHLCYSFDYVKKRFGVDFIHDTVTAIDVHNKKIITRRQVVEYDFVIIACGSETNFYGNTDIQNNAYTLDSVSDAQYIVNTIKKKLPAIIVVCGGGYTGIEVITNTWRYCKKRNVNMRLCIVERDPSLIPTLPSWMQIYTYSNMKSLGIDIYCNTTIDHLRDNSIILSDGTHLPNAMVIWTAGVKIPDFIQTVDAEHISQGRIAVDQYLRINESCYIVGDAASVVYKNVPLRMSVQFSLMEGRHAAENIKRSLQGNPLRPFKPVDLGFIIPMANNKSCGSVRGIPVRGRGATLLHYGMCLFRTFTIPNKIGILKDLLL